MPLQADQQPPEERDETHETPAKTASWRLENIARAHEQRISHLEDQT